MSHRRFTKAQQRAYKSGKYRVRVTWRLFITTIRGEKYTLDRHDIRYVYPDDLPF